MNTCTTRRLLLADDHEIVREGLSAHLRALGGFEVAHAWSLESLLRLAAQPPGFDLAIVDVHMPGMDEGRGLETLVQAQPGLPLVILSGATVLPLTSQWRSWPSVRAIVHKSSPVAELRAAIDLALGGHTVVTDLPLAPHGDREALATLSPRLAQVAHAAALGLNNAQIAAELHLSEGTVKQYLKTVFRTLGVANRTQLALLLQNGARPDASGR